jgi:hypothetical protein
VLPTQGRVGRFPGRNTQYAAHNSEALDKLQMRSANE